MMEQLNQWVLDINSVLWGVFFMIPILCGTGIFYTFKLRFVQVRHFPLCLRLIFRNTNLFGKKADNTGMSPLQALATAVAAQVGTGNVAGAATALAAGGPGALFWLWVAAFFGMATIFAEAVLAQTYKEIDAKGHVVGGPSYYIIKGMGPKFKPLAIFFSTVAIITMGGGGSLVQSNTISNAMFNAFDIPYLVSGILIAAFTGFVIFGGIRRLATLAETIVPFMAGAYLLGGGFVLLTHADMILPALETVVIGAFNPEAIGGGALGLTVAKAMQYGVARGLFSNEAGIGSTPHAHAVAKVEHPAEQGLMAIFGVFTTLLIVTFTILVIMVTGVLDYQTTGIELTQKAYTVAFGDFGVMFVAVCLLFFAFTTIIGWYFFSEQNVRFLFNGRGITAYRLLVCGILIVGACLQVNLVWSISDMCNAMMVIPNLIALLALNKVVGNSLNDFEEKLKAIAKK